MNYTKLIVYHTKMWPTCKLFFNRGEAVDTKAEWHEHMLNVPTDFAMPEAESTVYRAVCSGYKTEWYLSAADAKAAAGDKEVYYIDEAILMPPTLCNLTPPVATKLKKNERGNLECRINVHPEIYGSKAEGMVVFPSKWCDQEKLCEGPAIITHIIDKETFGFYFAEMLQYSLPSDEAIAKFIRKHNLERATFKFIESKFGKYIRIENIASDLRAIRFMKKNDIVARRIDKENGKLVTYTHPVYDGSNEQAYMVITGQEFLDKFAQEAATPA